MIRPQKRLSAGSERRRSLAVRDKGCSRAEKQQGDQAALPSSSEGAEPAISIRRGFAASGTSRTRSTHSKPFTREAPATRICSANWNLRSKPRVAIPLYRYSRLPSASAWASRPSHRERSRLGGDLKIGFTEARNGNRNAILVLGELLNVVGWKAGESDPRGGERPQSRRPGDRNRQRCDKAGKDHTDAYSEPPLSEP